jgi:hypothetical protein
LGPREEKVTTKGNVSFALEAISRFPEPYSEDDV